MGTPGNKPRDIKNLKARLGRTITPGQAGMPSQPPAAGSMPPPTMGAPTPAPGSVPMPGMMAPPGFPGAARPGSLPPPAVGGRVGPSGIPGAIAAPPSFAQPARAAAASFPPAARAPKGDPFGAPAPAQAHAEKRVTIVIDDSAVKDDEIGRKSKSRSMLLLGIGLVLGLAVGAGMGSTGADRNQYNMAVRDAKDIYAKVQEVSKIVDEAKRNIKSAVDASSGGAGKKASVDYKAIETLVAMKRPFTANEFSARRYRAFDPNTVNDLFDFYNNTNMMWDRFSILGAKTAGATKREALDKSASSADSLINNEFGIVMFKQGDAFAGGLVFLKPPPPPAEGAAAEPKKEKKGDKEPEAVKVLASTNEGGREVERTLFSGQADFGEKSDQYAIALDKMRSRSILGDQASLFSEYRAMLMDANGILDKTVETQGRLMKSLGQIASLEERKFF
jgi:hypothetical protein